MINLASLTHEELLSYLYAQGGLTEAEITLMDRLTMALDEIEALSMDLGLKNGKYS
jgi:hypothetical protein